jgi:uncharacterized membrane protein
MNMLSLQIVVTWLHVLFGILWFGGTLYATFILGPAVMSLPAQSQLALFRSLMNRKAPLVFEVVGGITILLGIIRGTLLGPVQTLDFLFGTAYGITWAIALLLGLGILAWSHFVSTPATEPMVQAMAAGDTAAARRAMPLLLVELAGFFGVFTCMILMRFGL